MVDSFDELLDKLASVLTRPSTSDDYGSQGSGFVTLATNVPCHISTGRGRPKEFAGSGQTAAVNYRTIFLRPWLDASGNSLSHKNWLLVDGQLYDIIQIDNPGELDHHYEVFCQMVIS